jgi:hypothetical protein
MGNVEMMRRTWRKASVAVTAVVFGAIWAKGDVVPLLAYAD